MAIDTQMLKKKISRTCEEAARSVLSSLLLYVSERAEGPQAAGHRAHRASRPLQPQEVGQRPTRFQLLQAKFMGAGREPHLKKIREVGRLISKDKQGPGRSFVNATINKLLEKTKEGAGSSGQRTPASEKPRWSPLSGKSTVKNILKKFLAAEEKEAKEKEAREKPPAPRPGAARGLLPRIVGRGSILSKLKERFEQSSCLHSEAGVLPLHREGRKSKSIQKKKVHRPQVRVLHVATMATSCTRVPPARFLACTAEPLPALSIATIVCGPQSWLSHCAKLSHSESRRWPISEACNSKDPESGGNKIHGLMSVEHGEQLKSLGSQAVARVENDAALSMGFSGVSCKGNTLPGQVPVLSPPGPVSPRGTGPVGKDRTVEPKTLEVAVDTQGVKDDAGEAPEITMTVCSSEDEAERALLGSEREPFFAAQRRLPAQEAVTQIPLLAPLAVQAERRAQPAMEPPQITVQLPVVHQMPASPGPLRSVASCDDNHSQVLRREDTTENKQPAFSTGNEDRRGHQAPTILSKSREAPMGLHPAADPGDDTGMEGGASQLFLKPRPLEIFPGRIERKHSLEKSHDLGYGRDSSKQSSSDLNRERHLCPESNETPTPSDGTPGHPTAGRSSTAVGVCSATGLRQGVPSTELVPPETRTKPESSIVPGKGSQFGQEECKGPLDKSAEPPNTAQENISRDLGNNSQSTIDKQPVTSIRASGEVTARGAVTGLTTPQSRGTQNPEHKMPAWAEGAQDTEHDEIMPHAGDAKAAEYKKMPQTSSAQDAKRKQASWATGTQNNAHKTVLQPHASQGVESEVTPQLGGSREPKHKLALWPSGTQDAERKITPWQDSTQDTKQMTPWPGGTQDKEQRVSPQPRGSQDPEHKTVSQTGDTQDAEHETTLWAGGIRNPRQKATAQPGGTQDTKYKIRPRAGGTQDTEHKMAAQPGNVQAGEQSLGHKTAPWSGSVQDYKDKVTQGPSSHPSLVSSRSSKHKSRGTDGNLSEDVMGSHLLTPAAPAVQPGDAADSCLVPTECPPAVSKGGAGTENKIAAVERDPQCKSTVSPRPQENPTEHPGQSHLPCVGQQALDRKYPEREQPFSGAAHSPTHPRRPATKGETRQVETARGPEPPVPSQKAERRSLPQVKGLESEAKESLPTQVDMGRPQSHLGSGETGTRRASLHQTGQPDAAPRVAKPRALASQDLVMSAKKPEGENLCQHRDRDQERLPGPLGRQKGCPTQGDSLQADEHLATPGNSRKPGGLTVQKRTQSQGQAGHPVPQAWGQPDSTPEGAPTAGTRGEPPRPGPVFGRQRSPCAQHLPQENQFLASSRAAVSSLETADDGPGLTPNAGGHQLFQPLAQDEPPNAPRAEKDLSDHAQRRSTHFAKYYAQSFSDQKAFDLSFRPTVLRASDTFEPPK